MQCEEFEDRLNAVLDERRRPECDAELRLHAEILPRLPPCGGRLSHAARRLLRNFVAPNAPADMPARVLAELHSQALARAAQLGVVGLGPGHRRRSADRRGAAGASTAHRAGAGSASSRLRSSRWPSCKTPGRPSRPPRPPCSSRIAKETASPAWPRRAAAAWPPSCSTCRASAAAAESSMPRARSLARWRGGREHATWAVQMSKGLKPLTESMSETFNLLLRSLPPTDSAGRS